MITEHLFWDVDTQYDFMRQDGCLYVPDSESIIPTLKRLTDYAHARGTPIVASADDHESGHRELSADPDFLTTFPPHCMRGTPGQEKIPETALRNPLVIQPEPEDPITLGARIAGHDGDFLLLKHWFDVFTNANVGTLLEALRPVHIVLYGVALDVCDRYAIEGLLQHQPESTLWFVTDAARAIRPETVAPLLEEWKARGVRMVSADDVVSGSIVE
ncbi:MAG TPA: cysteine hydrolase family protein [Gemmatimonadales bacterium]|jgi:nicotinamidase/pyrazinamidase|nr:cysteine hydrolase family protein [Gemmatimonadales bacterium]